MNIEEAEFGEFWKLYPKKKSKGDAWVAWQQHKKNRPPLSDVLKAIVVLRETEDWLKNGGQYIPYPASWIRAWGWADVPEMDKSNVRGDQLWWKTVSGVKEKAKELNMEWDALNGETFQQFAARVKETAQANKVVPLASNG
jgi:hypothetical protein